MLSRKTIAAALLLFSFVAAAQNRTDASENEILSRVAEFHGAAGVFAVAGYRIGGRALSELNEKRGSFNLDVTHYTPFEVQWSCIADGIQAATGVSAGKLNLHMVETSRAKLETVIWDKRSGKILIVLRSIYLAFQRVRRGGRYVEEDFDLLLNSRGFLSRLFRPMFALIRRSWHMYPLGVLFGLGFDTATEIGLLSISAAEASKGLSFGSILVFPALFAAGMSLIDTTDNILMLGAYGWAFVKPIRKLYYNMTITLVSVIVAFVIGGIEALGLLALQFHLQGTFWGLVGKLNENFGTLGYLIIGLFTVSWIVSIWIYRWRRYNDLELNA